MSERSQHFSGDSLTFYSVKQIPSQGPVERLRSKPLGIVLLRENLQFVLQEIRI